MVGQRVAPRLALSLVALPSSSLGEWTGDAHPLAASAVVGTLVVRGGLISRVALLDGGGPSVAPAWMSLAGLRP